MRPPGPVPRLLRELAAELASALPRDRVRVWALPAAAILAQVAYWYLGSPGPATPRNPAQAAAAVVWAVALLGLVPALLARLMGLRLGSLGLGAGDAAAGRLGVLLGVLVAVAVGFVAATDPAIRATYPWPGSWAGQGIGHFAAWALLYGAYYASYEFFFRGFLLLGLEEELGRPWALWVQTLSSTLLHLGKPLVETLAALPAGLLFGALALRTRSVLYPAVVHLALGLATDYFSLLRQGALP